MNRTRLILVPIAAGLLAWAQNDGPGAGQGYLPEFSHSSRQILQLADATPAEKFAWRPATGVRSVSEVYMHIAVANFFLVTQTGAKLENMPKFSQTTEKDVKDKAAVVGWLKDSFEAVKTTYPKADLKKSAKFFGQDSNVENIYLRILAHDHEHMGQSIAYARMNGIVPPWSK